MLPFDLTAFSDVSKKAISSVDLFLFILFHLKVFFCVFYYSCHYEGLWFFFTHFYFSQRHAYARTICWSARHTTESPHVHTYIRTHTYFDSNSNTYLWRVLVRILLSYSWRICSNVWETFKSLRLRRQGTVQKATQIRTLYSISNTADIIIFPFFHAYRLFGRHQNINKNAVIYDCYEDSR